jgi:hypothetical protein
MLSRIFWIGIAGIAIIAGMILQNGRGILSWGAGHSRSQRIESRVDAAIDRSVDRMQVVGSDGEEIDVPADAKRALADAVGRLVKAETDLALLRVREADKGEIEATIVRRDRARAEVETLKARIERQKAQSEGKRDAIRDQIRDDVRDAVRGAGSH